MFVHWISIKRLSISSIAHSNEVVIARQYGVIKIFYCFSRVAHNEYKTNKNKCVIIVELTFGIKQEKKHPLKSYKFAAIYEAMLLCIQNTHSEGEEIFLWHNISEKRERKNHVQVDIRMWDVKYNTKTKPIITRSLKLNDYFDYPLFIYRRYLEHTIYFLVFLSFRFCLRDFFLSLLSILQAKIIVAHTILIVVDYFC